MPYSRVLDDRRPWRRFLDMVATAWAIAALAAIGLVAAAFALVLLPAVFFAVWCLDALHSANLID
jgi:hypothetical protein